MNTLIYLAARLREASSWAGLAATLLGSFHVANASGVATAFVNVLVALGGLIAVLVPEGGARR